MSNNRLNSTKANVQLIDGGEMDALLAGWGMEPINERTATADFVPDEFDRVKTKASQQAYRDDR